MGITEAVAGDVETGESSPPNWFCIAEQECGKQQQQSASQYGEDTMGSPRNVDRGDSLLARYGPSQ